MTPRELLAQARRLTEEAPAGTEGLWARAAAHLTRQALEMAVAVRLSKKVGSVEELPFSVQLLSLHAVCDATTAERAAYAWNALTGATHHHGYELAPAAGSLRTWIDSAERAVQGLDV